MNRVEEERGREEIKRGEIGRGEGIVRVRMGGREMNE